MGLLCNNVKVSLCGKNIKYYENLRYAIPKTIDKRGNIRVSMGTEIIVNVGDLPPKSCKKVKVKCDKCGKEYNMTYYSYLMFNHNNKIYCNSCANKLFISGVNNGNYGGKSSKYGQEHHKWNPNKTDDERIIGRNYIGYKNFIKKILARDNYTCRCCSKHHNNMEVHHLDGYDWCKDKRTDETNAITLCETCHKNFHMKYGRGGNTKEQFEEWIGYIVKLLKYKGELPTTRKIYCIEEDRIYDSAVELAKELGCNSIQIYNVCNRKNKTVYGKHLLWFDEYEKMDKEYIEKMSNTNITKDNHCISVICVTTNKIFKSLKEASEHYNIKYYNTISLCCNNKQKTAGKLENGTKLRWMYYKDYLKETI